MSVTATDIIFRKSSIVTDTTANGGRKSQIQVISGAKHNLFPRVTRSERIAGVTRYRKEFWCNDNASDETAYGVLIYLEHPSNAGDRFYFGIGTQTNTQGDIVTTEPAWYGCGQLETALSGGETSVKLTMENNDFVFPNNGYLHLTNKFATGQTVDSDVSIGDSVTYGGGTWSKIASTTDIDYPNGLYTGSNVVMTIQGSTNEEWLQLANNLYSDEDIGDGDGITTNPALTTLTNNTNGICDQPGLLPVVTATSGGSTRTVNVAADGSCSGYCSAGQLNMTTGVWTVDIDWTTAPDNATDIIITYRENCYLYAGNVATVYLETGEQVSNAYLTTNSFGSGCINAGDVITTISNWSENSVSGTYDESGYPLVMYNDGTEQDNWTLTFTSATNFTVSGTNEGSVGTGNVGADFSPTNANTGQPYFTIDKDGWAGTWAVGETVTFTTSPSAQPIWLKEVVPAGTAQESNNMIPLGYYAE